MNELRNITAVKGSELTLTVQKNAGTPTALLGSGLNLTIGYDGSDQISTLDGNGLSFTVNRDNTGKAQTITGNGLSFIVVVDDNDNLIGIAGSGLGFTSQAVANQAPTVNAGTDISSLVAAGNQLDGSASDDGLPLESVLTTLWSVVSKPIGATDPVFADATDPQTTVTFVEEGTYVLRLTASDGELSSHDDVSLLLTLNQAPTVNAGPDASTPMASGAYTLQGSGSDPDSDPITYTWSVVSKPGGALDPVFGNIHSATSSVTFTTRGAYTLRLTADDGNGGVTTDDVVIIVTNTAPVVNAGPDASPAMAAGAYTLQGSGSDADSDSVTYTWSVVSKPGGASDPVFGNIHSLTSTVTFTTRGAYTLRLTADDGNGGVTTDDVVITAANTAPVVNAGPDASPAMAAGAYTLQGSGSDADSDSVTYTWSVVSKPGGAANPTFSNTHSLTSTVTFTTRGAYTLRLTADDGQGGVTTDDVVITAANTAPTVNAGADGSTILASKYTLQGSGSDADSDSVTYTWSVVSKPGGASDPVFDNANSPTSKVLFSTAGAYTLRLTADDGQGGTTTDDVVITGIANPTGGTVTTSGGNRIHTFNSNGNFVIAANLTVDALLVGGGGGGGFGRPSGFERGGGGGGGGGARELAGEVLTTGTYAVVVGGGAPGLAGSGAGNPGDPSTFHSKSAAGGGGGNGNLGAGQSGGCGGGGQTTGGAGGAGNTPSTSPSQGKNGGVGSDTTTNWAGGGGGASVAGVAGDSGGQGGAGLSSSYSGSAVVYGSGGGGGAVSTAVTGASGGAGAGTGGGTSTGAGTSGTANRGGGGGGGCGKTGGSNTGGNGGDGVVIIRYPIVT